MKTKLADIFRAINSSRFVRAYLRFARGRGPLLAAGIAYMGLFSLTAALTVGWTAFSGVLARRPLLRESVAEAVNTQIPGLLKSSSNPQGVIDPDTLVSVPGESLTGWIALGIAVVSASTVIWYLGLALRSMFGLTEVRARLLPAILGRIGGLIVLMLGVAAIAVLTLIATFLRKWIAESFGHSVNLAVNYGTVLIPFFIDMLVFIAMITMVARVRCLKRDLFLGALLAAIGSTALRTLGSNIVGSVSSPLLATATSLVTIILWLNFIGWITLYAAAWTSNPPPPGTPTLTTDRYQNELPNYVTLSVPETLTWVEGGIALSQAHDLKTAHPNSAPGKQKNSPPAP